MSKLQSFVEIDGDLVAEWEAFHDVFAAKFGFPAFYGRNDNAWIDCMTSVDSPDDGLSEVHVPRGQIMTLQIANAAKLKSSNRDIWDALNEMTAFVNWRRIERGDEPVLALSY